MLRASLSLSMLILLGIIFSSCTNSEKKLLSINDAADLEERKEVTKRFLSEEFKTYWYAGAAEITSYRLSQERYGALREGTAVNVFVTEDFLPEQQVKANNPSEENIPVLKLNSMKNYLTGIYPYSIMTSTFNPVETRGHSIKVSNSVQEWCGHVYMQLNNRKNFEIVSHSYFEGEADQELSLEKTYLENELWNLVRINPEELPTGDLKMVPSFEYLRLRHKKAAAYNAFGSLKQGLAITSYTVSYPELKRELTIYFKSTFPFEIEKWEEISPARNQSQEPMITTAVKMERIVSPYWNKNNNRDIILRDSLGL